jgi:putative intracellular protease/amidase
VEVAILLHEGVSAVEALGPFAVLRRVPAAQVRLVAARPGRVSTQDPALDVTAMVPIGAMTEADVLVLPGGLGAPYLGADEAVVDWVRTVHASSAWTAATSTGCRLLEAAGIAADDDHTLTADGAADAVELALTVAGRVGGLAVADRIRPEVAGGDVREWHRDAEAAAAPPPRWHQLLNRARHGSLVIEHDDSRSRAFPPQIPKGWRGPTPTAGSAADE